MTYLPLLPSDPDSSTLRAHGLHAPIVCASWDEYGPSATTAGLLPRADAWLAHDGEALHVFFDVVEDGVKALYTRDQDPVWRESCVEVFLNLPGSNGPDGYYNFEFNAIGTLLSWFGKDRHTRDAQPGDVLALVERKASMGTQAVPWTPGIQAWTLQVRIPARAFGAHDIAHLTGLVLGMNLYKCGDDLPQRHYLSWQKIQSPSPDFHRPESFVLVECV